MPGLLRGIARTAVVAGTATHVSNNVSRRQARKFARQDAESAQEAPVATEPAQDDIYIQLEKLGQLKNDGILTQEEFDAKKHQLLGL